MDVKEVICRDLKYIDTIDESMDNLAVEKSGENKINIKYLTVDKLYGFNPFLMDYFAADIAEKRDFAHLSCSPGNALLNKVRPLKYACKYSSPRLNGKYKRT